MYAVIFSEKWPSGYKWPLSFTWNGDQLVPHEERWLADATRFQFDESEQEFESECAFELVELLEDDYQYRMFSVEFYDEDEYVLLCATDGFGEDSF